MRALQNILSKLEHSLVCDADLVQEKHLHIRLLEWFNFATCPMQPQVLGLVLRMAKVGMQTDNFDHVTIRGLVVLFFTQ